MRVSFLFWLVGIAALASAAKGSKSLVLTNAFVALTPTLGSAELGLRELVDQFYEVQRFERFPLLARMLLCFSYINLQLIDRVRRSPVRCRIPFSD